MNGEDCGVGKSVTVWLGIRFDEERIVIAQHPRILVLDDLAPSPSLWLSCLACIILLHASPQRL